jgi:hypothetical protein
MSQWKPLKFQCFFGAVAEITQQTPPTFAPARNRSADYRENRPIGL